MDFIERAGITPLPRESMQGRAAAPAVSAVVTGTTWLGELRGVREARGRGLAVALIEPTRFVGTSGETMRIAGTQPAAGQ